MYYMYACCPNCIEIFELDVKLVAFSALLLMGRLEAEELRDATTRRVDP